VTGIAHGHELLPSAGAAVTCVQVTAGKGGSRARRRVTGSPTAFPAGTIVSCPDCGEGLYKVITRATAQELVLDNGVLLVPLNRTIPSRGTWQRFACPWCGGRLLNKQGKVHTLQQGWS
jgi:predicted RNA-binding Zn-ribbon protein involved in translation (DUF1610 family)